MFYSIRDAMNYAASKVGIEGWQGYQWEAAEGGCMVKGCCPSGMFKRGPRKGSPKFRPALPGTQRTVVVSDADMQTFALAYEADTGNCWVCKGDGHVFAGWSRAEGTRTRLCVHCNATGAPTPQPAEEAGK